MKFTAVDESCSPVHRLLGHCDDGIAILLCDGDWLPHAGGNPGSLGSDVGGDNKPAGAHPHGTYSGDDAIRKRAVPGRWRVCDKLDGVHARKQV